METSVLLKFGRQVARRMTQEEAEYRVDKLGYMYQKDTYVRHRDGRVTQSSHYLQMPTGMKALITQTHPAPQESNEKISAT